MYSDREKRKPVWLLLIPILAAALAVFLIFRGSGRNLSEESAAAIRDTIQRSALQCYAVEGVYPENLRYLEENYGLQINTRDYYVTYDAFASNLPPNVIVTAKGKGRGTDPERRFHP